MVAHSPHQPELVLLEQLEVGLLLYNQSSNTTVTTCFTLVKIRLDNKTATVVDGNKSIQSLLQKLSKVHTVL